MAKTKPFDEAPERYDEWFEKNKAAYESELEAVRAQIPPGANGIEIGVGSARFAAPLGIQMGVEPSAAMRKLAEARGVEAVDARAEKLPFIENWFDVVLMVSVVCFLDDVETALREARRILKYDGSLIIALLDRESPVGRAYEAAREEGFFFKEARLYSVAEVVELLGKVGFNEMTFTQTIFRMPEEIKEPEPAREGHGEGLFVVINAKKRRAQR